jgi:hypothetical protein
MEQSKQKLLLLVLGLHGVVPPVILHLQLLSPSAEPYLSLTDCHSSLA